jgi:F0F1-type ATP synthase assembly protein I
MEYKSPKLDDIEARKQALMHKTFVMMLQVLIVFGIPGLIALFVGKKIDGTYGSHPYGILGASVVAMIFSWAIIIRMYKQLSNGFKQLKNEEEAEEERLSKSVEQ